MPFTVLFHDAFVAEFDKLPERVQDELLARTEWLEEFGPDLGRPNVDTLNESTCPNMKELRFRLDGLWRFAFAWDPRRQAVILCGGQQGRRQPEAVLTKPGPVGRCQVRRARHAGVRCQSEELSDEDP